MAKKTLFIFVLALGGLLALPVTAQSALGTEVSAPGAMLLVGGGLMAMAAWGRKKIRK